MMKTNYMDLNEFLLEEVNENARPFLAFELFEKIEEINIDPTLKNDNKLYLTEDGKITLNKTDKPIEIQDENLKKLIQIFRSVKEKRSKNVKNI